MTKPSVNKPKKSRQEAKPDLTVLHKHLFNEFLNEPGVFESLVALLEQIKQEGDEGGDSKEPPDTEAEFLPPAESSRLSNCSPAPVRPTLPPQSPRPAPTDSPLPSDQEEQPPFYLQRNIDGVPERNLVCSPSPSPSPPAANSGLAIKRLASTTGEHSQAGVKTLSATPSPSSRPSSALTSPVPTPRQALTPTTSADSSHSSPVPVTPAVEVAHISSKGTIPRFHLPFLSPPLLPQSLVEKVQTFFLQQPGERVTPATALLLSSVLNIQPYLCLSLFSGAFGAGAAKGSCAQLLSFLQANSLLLQEVDEEERSFHLLGGCSGRPFLVPGDIQLLVRAVLNNHNQLEFFRCDPSSRGLHGHYITSVLSTIFFRAGGSAWRTRRLSLHQFRQLSLLDTLDRLWEGTQDINFLDYFSYDQFYVFYVKFAELCGGEGASPAELLQWEDGGQLSRLLVERLWRVPGAVDRSGSMQYWHWVGFLLAEVDKSSVSALEYWFPVLDTDGDGFLSLGELHQFYRESLLLLILNNAEVRELVVWDDISTQLLDILGPQPVSLPAMRSRHSDRLAHMLDAFINIYSFIVNDERDSNPQSGHSPVQRFVVRSLQEM